MMYVDDIINVDDIITVGDKRTARETIKNCRKMETNKKMIFNNDKTTTK